MIGVALARLCLSGCGNLPHRRFGAAWRSQPDSMHGRLFTLCLAAAATSGCLSLLAPDVDRALVGHAAVSEATAQSTCLSCHHPVQVAPDAMPAMTDAEQAPRVPEWMLHERGGVCLACHGVDP